MRILLADDNTVAVDSVASTLRAWGHEVDVVYGGKECVARARKEPGLDVIVLDMSMPGTSGASVLEEFVSWSPAPRFKVIVTTAYIDWQTEMIGEKVRSALKLETSYWNMTEKKLPEGLVIGDLDKSEGFEVILSRLKQYLELVASQSKT